MADSISIRVSTTELRELLTHGCPAAILRAARKAGSTALRDMRAEASKRIRARKRIRVSATRRVLDIRTAKGSTLESLEWALRVRGGSVPLSAYPHRQVKSGVSVEVNVGERKILKSAFVATMRSGHEGIFLRRGSKRLPIAERMSSRPVDVLLNEGEADALATRGQVAFGATFMRLLPIEMAKENAR